MAGFLSDNVLDFGVDYIYDNAETLHVCSAMPSSYANVAAVTLGNKPTPTVGAPTNGASNGRRVVVSAITDGEVTGTDIATHWCLVKDSATAELLAAQTLSAPQAVTDGNVFTLDAISITIPDAT
jgi:hypothetical protein